MGGGSTTVEKESELQKQQAKILESLSPLIQQYGLSILPLQQTLDSSKMSAMQSIMPQLTQQLQSYASGTPTAQQQMTLANTQQQQRQQAANMGIRPGDPRLMQGFQQSSENLAKGSSADIQTLMSLFGNSTGNMSAGSLLSQMGTGRSAGSSTSLDTTGQDVAGGVGSAVSLAALIAAMLA